MTGKSLLGKWLLGASVVSLLATSTLAMRYPAMPGTKDKTDQRQKMRGEHNLRVKRTNKLIGHEVKGRDGETLGTIHDLVLTPDRQRVSYVALSSGGIWGIGDDLYAIPWSQLHEGPGDSCRLDVSKAQFKNATTFKDDQWPVSADAQWQSATRTNPSQQDVSKDQEQKKKMAAKNREVQSRRVTQLTGMDIKNYSDQTVGTIEGFVVAVNGGDKSMSTSGNDQKRGSRQSQQIQSEDQKTDDQSGSDDMNHRMRGGHVVYTVVSMGGFLGFDEEYALIPANAVHFQSQRDFARVDADKETLKSIAFEDDQWPNISDRSYAQDLYDDFETEPYWIVLGYIVPVTDYDYDAASEKAWDINSQYNQNFDAKNVKTVEGTVQSVGTFRPASGVQDGLRLRVKTDEGKTVTVHAGPQWFAQQEKCSFKSGDKVKVTGSKTKVNGRSVIMSTEIECDGKTLELRNKSGQPQWKREKSQSQSQGMSQQSNY